MGHSNTGGQSWVDLQYLAGLESLGHHVTYLEDFGDDVQVWNWTSEEWTDDPGYPAMWIERSLDLISFGGAWAVRAGGGTLGLAPDEIRAECRSADLLLMRALPLWTWRPEYELPRRRAFIDVDPGFTQVAIANGDVGFAAALARCERLFSFGQYIGQADCPIPAVPGPWIPTRPPVVLAQWPIAHGRAEVFTTVMRWGGRFEGLTFGDLTLGQRDREFQKFIDLPLHAAQRLLVAAMGVDPDLLARHGWEYRPGERTVPTPSAYRAFISASRAEFAVAKHGYVVGRTGWFSDRSVCYLASGRPVVVEDTRLDWLPVGEGLLVYSTIEEAVAAIETVNRAYRMHRRAARHLAETVFSTDVVLPRLLDQATS